MLIDSMITFSCDSTPYTESFLTDDNIDTHQFKTQYGVAQVSVLG